MSYTTKTIGTVSGTVSMEYRFIIADTEPTPVEGYIITQVADLGELGKLYMEYKLVVT